MPLSKRKHSESGEDSASDFSNNELDDNIDISSALTGKKQKIDSEVEISDEDEDFSVFLQDSIAKRNVKNGTEMLKKTKGKSKLAKGEVGGGSFQSMGTFNLKRKYDSRLIYR